MLNKRVLLGISGGIAAYKIAFLIRLLKKSGAEVKVVMTPSSVDFISPLVVATLSENPVSIEFWDKQNGLWTNHVDLALWADVFVIAPLTANTLSKISHGACDNLLSAVYLSAKSPVLVAPAMDLDMYAHPTTKENLRILQQHSVKVIPAENGELASGLSGEGRMAEPETIFNAILESLSLNEHFNTFQNKKVLITAGPTFENIDPVRFVGNRSSGKMGFAIAEEFLNRGAYVHLITGPTHLKLSHPNLSLIRIQTALELESEVQKIWNEMQIGVFAAAVADYRPESIEKEKIKKQEEELTIRFVKNPDVLAWAGANKNANQLLVGFALESQNLIENGKDKLQRKNADVIVMNSIKDEGAGFEYETNKISILDRDNKLSTFELKSKDLVARDIVNYIANYSK
jgi:phosphopantothenoylcysteine decarboxylase/phosphopantothenate--cysteine ligase